MTDGDKEANIINPRRQETSSKAVWFLSIPGDPSRHEAYANTFNSLDLRQIEKFGRLKVPSFKLITYDRLIEAMGALKALDKHCNMLLDRTEEKLLEVLPQDHKLYIAYTVTDKSFLEYLDIFEWDRRKYPDDMSISEVVKNLSEDIQDMHDQFQHFNFARRDAIVSLETYDRKTSGCVATKDINSMIPDETYIVESKNLTTLFVVVPKILSKVWYETYEHITQQIIPDSSHLMNSDGDFDLYSLVIWKPGAEAFKEFISTETELTFRVYHFNKKEFQLSKDREGRLRRNEKETTYRLISWLRINFRRIFLNTVHVKLLRVHVESLIRYGIPFRFQIVFIQPYKKKAKKLLKDINALFKHLELKITKEVKKEILDPQYTTYPFTTMSIIQFSKK